MLVWCVVAGGCLADAVMFYLNRPKLRVSMKSIAFLTSRHGWRKRGGRGR